MVDPDSIRGIGKIEALAKHIEGMKVNEERNNKLLHNWLQDVDNLYATIVQWIEKANAGPQFTFSVRPIKLDEDPWGEYDIAQLRIVTKLCTIRATPQGMNICGAQGRVDFHSKFGTVEVLRVSHGNWKIFSQPMFGIRNIQEYDESCEFRKFNEDTLADLLNALILGK